MTQGVLKVGEVVLGFGFQIDVEYNGLEGVVTEYLGEQNAIHRHSKESLGIFDMYKVEWKNGEDTDVMRHNLKRKKPPEQKKFSGEEMVLHLFKCNKQLIEEYA